MLLRFSIRRLFRHWRLNLVVLLGLSLASALLAGLPSFAATTAMNSLHQSLADEHPAARNIEISGVELSGALNKYISDFLGDLLLDRMVVRTTTLTTDPLEPLVTVDKSNRPGPQYLTVWSFDNMQEYLDLVEGQWPEYYEPHTLQEQQQMMFHNEIDAVIDQATATQLELQTGDRLNVHGSPVEFLIVGIIEKQDPKSEIWWGDPMPFEPLIRPGVNEDTVSAPLIIYPRSMSEYLAVQMVSWRLLLDHTQISADNAQRIEESLINLKTQVKISRASMTSNLPNLLLAYRENLSMTRMVLLLLSIQAFLFTLYTLSLIISLLLERSEGEIATLTGRGASSLQITRIFATESLLMTIFAGLVIGPGLAYLSLFGWSKFSGESIPGMLPLDAWILAMIGAGFGWLALVFSIYPVARRSMLEWQRRKARPAQLTGWQRKYLDILLLVLGGIAYWQLTTSGSFVLRRVDDTNLADPLLLLGPSILLIALALLLLRLFPYFLRLGARLARLSRGLIWSIGLSRLARAPVQPSKAILLISMATGLAVFALSFGQALKSSQAEIAHYQAGADFRVNQGNNELDDFTTIPGVIQVSPVYRSTVTNAEGKLTTVLAVDSETFTQVAAQYPQGMTNLTIETVISGLESGDEQVTVPAIFSKSALGANQIGEEQRVKFSQYSVPVSSRGMIVNFPTISGAFILVDLTTLQNAVDLNAGQFYRNHEIWLSVQPESHQALAMHPLLENSILADAQRILRSMQNNAFANGSLRAFRLNGAILTMLSIMGFFLVSYFSTRQRAHEFGILRAMGLSSTKVFQLLIGEGALIFFLGLLGGTGIGYALTKMTRPYLNFILSRVMSGTLVYQISIDWQSVAILYGVLSVFYTLAILFALGGLLRTGIHRVMRIGDE